ncbi:MAG: hypothetical protein R3B72_18295 [Polyangiaceae bacterium]
MTDSSAPNAECIVSDRDVRQCGNGSTVCSPSKTCVAGICTNPEVVLGGLTAPHAILLDGNTVFVSEGNSILSVPKSGGSPAVVTTTFASPRRMAVVGNELYFADYTASAIMKVPKTGGTAQVVSSTAAPTELAIAGNYVYFSGGSPSTSIRRAPLSGGTPELVASSGGSLLRADPLGTTLLYMPNESELWRADPLSNTTALYWSEAFVGTDYALAIDDEAAYALRGPISHPTAPNLKYLGQAYQVLLDGSPARKIFDGLANYEGAYTTYHIYSTAVRDETLYMYATGGVHALDTCGSSYVKLLQDPPGAGPRSDVLVDETHVYVVIYNAIWRFPR